MRTRREIKSFARQAFAAQRGRAIWAPILVFLVISIVSAIPVLWTHFSIISNIEFRDLEQYLNEYIRQFALEIDPLIAMITSLISLSATVLSIVLAVNLNGFYVKIYYGQQAKATEPFSVIAVNFGRKLGGMLWMSLWIYLWTLVGIFTLFIPTILKTLSYSMTPYILASNPNVSATNALSLSIRMTKGHRGKIFVMHLSFIGWQILNGLTLGILGLFYVNPYMFTSLAGLFVELRNNAVATAAISTEELDFGALRN